MRQSDPFFWEQFEFAPNCKFFVANSHLCIIEPPVQSIEPHKVVSYDAHHDCGYGRPNPLSTQTFTCEDWVYLYAYRGCMIDIVYPDWKDAAFSIEKTPRINRTKFKDQVSRQFNASYCLNETPVEGVSAVFICLSGSWVPPWCDGQFWDFVKSCPVQAPYQVLSAAGPPLERSFDLNKAIAEFNSLTVQMAKRMVVREQP